MNRQGWIVVAVMGMAGLVGCASQGTKLTKRDPRSEVDDVKVASVNEWARTHGAVIRWINAPVKNETAARGN
jgi:hypothetical protein